MGNSFETTGVVALGKIIVDGSFDEGVGDDLDGFLEVPGAILGKRPVLGLGVLPAELLVYGVPAFSGDDFGFLASEGLILEFAPFDLSLFFSFPIGLGGAVDHDEVDALVEASAHLRFDGGSNLREFEVPDELGV